MSAKFFHLAHAYGTHRACQMLFWMLLYNNEGLAGLSPQAHVLAKKVEIEINLAENNNNKSQNLSFYSKNSKLNNLKPE